MYVEEGADILFLDSPADDEEIRRARGRRQGAAVLRRAVARRAARHALADAKPLELGFKIGTYPTGMLSPAAAGMKAGLAALKAGEAESKSALSPAELRATLGYADYDTAAKPFIVKA